MSNSIETIPTEHNNMVDNNKLVQEVKFGRPVDFSFRGIRAINALKNDVPRMYRLRGAPERGPNKKHMSASVWLNHNNLLDLNGLKKLVDEALEMPKYLTWLDVSQNELKNIDLEILNFKHLRILYMHGNQIKDMAEVSKLKPLPELKTLTLYGNPISRISDYRRYVLFYLPQVRSLDFSLFTRENRKAVSPIDCV